MRERTEGFRIRRKLAGLTNADIGELLHMNPDRAGELLGGRGAFKDLHELRCELRSALNCGPDLRRVHAELSQGELVPGRAGRDARWARTILDQTLRQWSAEAGHSVCWWSIFERDELAASHALESESLATHEVQWVGGRMKEAAEKLAALFPYTTAPLQGRSEESG
jgi:hypothetical protein